jgi:benzodiazapine receptor
MSQFSGSESLGWTLAAGVALCVAVGALAGLSTRAAIPGWYATLIKPSYNPPNAIFGPVWTALYILMGLAAGLVWRQPRSALRIEALACFALQLTLNFLWSLIFFRWHRIGVALAELALLWLAILSTLLWFWQIRPLAAWLMLPYLGWVSFAAALNAAIFRLNR